MRITRIILVVAAVMLTCGVLPASPVDMTTMSLVGNAQLINGNTAIQLTNGGSGQLSAAWYPTALSTESDLSFAFSYYAQGTGIWADGFTFAMQTAGPTSIGAVGGNLGIHAIGSPFVYVGFDYYGYLQDLTNGSTKDSIRIQTSSDSYWVHVASQSNVTPNIWTGNRWVWIDYLAGTHVLSVYYSDSPSRPSSPFLSGTVDLSATLGSDTMYVGFTGASYIAGGVQNITGFDIAPEPAPGLLTGAALMAAGFFLRRLRRGRL